MVKTCGIACINNDRYSSNILPVVIIQMSKNIIKDTKLKKS